MLLVCTLLLLAPFNIWARQEITPEAPKSTYSINAAHALVGDENLCIVIGGVIGNYSAGGEAGDVYSWVVTKSTGEVLVDRSGGDQLESIKVVYSEIGDYNVNLKVRRGTDSNFFEQNLAVKVQKGADLVLLPDYLKCGEDPVLLTAIDPAIPNLANYSITWFGLDGDGEKVELASGNEFLTNGAGYHLVEVFLVDGNGNKSCTINGSTFVGPPIDYKITQTSEQICQRETITISTDTPLSGEWFIQGPADPERISLGNAFEVQLNANELAGPGTYEVTFSAVDDRYPDCPSVRQTTFEVLQSPELTATVLVNPDDCKTGNGTFEVTSSSDLTSLSIPELNFEQENIVAGQTLTFPDVLPQIYTLVATQNGCKSYSLVQVDANTPPVFPDPDNSPIFSDIEITNETCSDTGVTAGTVNITFPSMISSAIIRVLHSSRGEVRNIEVTDSDKAQITLSSGTYKLEINTGGCTYPSEQIRVEDAPQLEFSVPDSLNICEVYKLLPESAEDATFTLTFPDGSVETQSSGNPFNLTAPGDYSITAVANGSSTLCPTTHTFTATISNKITFLPELIEEGCFDPIRYVAVIDGLELEEVSIRWLNSENEIVGRGYELYPSQEGIFSLLVQPLASGYCPVTPVEFEVKSPVTNVPVELAASKICPPPGSGTITLTTDQEEVLFTEWIFYDSANNRKVLPEFNDLYEIQVNEKGTYEAVVYNKLRCEIGRNFVTIEESITTQPTIEESYAICSKENTLSPLDPGEYVTYKWYFKEEIISTDRLYKPLQVGDYKLIVTTEDGCELIKDFRTYDGCNFNIVYPNAMVLSDPNRDFRVLVSEGVTEAELFVLNRQGELIHHVLETDVPLEVPILSWDGTVNGSHVPTGTYAVVILLRNPVFGFEEKKTGALTILD